MRRSLLVPVDFQQPTINALNFAINIAANNNYEIDVLHIIRSENDRKDAMSKLEKLVSDQNAPANVSITAHAVIGNIENDISKTGQTLKSNFIIMGTHGASGLHKYFGSKAIDVISESKTPFIVVQSDSKMQDTHKIAMTIDLEKESIQIVKVAAKLAKEFNAEIVLVGGDHTDPALKSKVAVNVNTTRKLLNEQGIQSSVALLERKDFLDNFIEYCKTNKVDFIAATYYADTFSVFSKKFVQKLLENNANIPVLTLDSDSISVGHQYSFITQ